MTVDRIFKYPRTPHLSGSRRQPGDQDVAGTPMSDLEGLNLVIEEKVDGANSGIGFDAGGRLLLQSRGHFLTGGHRERHFNMLKTWATGLKDRLWRALGSRYLMYGEWMYAKHTIFYDVLPHYFLEFDILDKSEGIFLSTERRQELLRDLPVASVQVLASGTFRRAEELTALITGSAYKSVGWREALAQEAERQSLDVDRSVRQSDPSDLMEGLYVKIEQAGAVLGRLKYVRPDFRDRVAESGSHWQSRPILPNALAPGANLFDRT